MLDDFFGQLLPLRLGVIEQGHLEHPQSAPIQIHFIARVDEGETGEEASADELGIFGLKAWRDKFSGHWDTSIQSVELRCQLWYAILALTYLELCVLHRVGYKGTFFPRVAYYPQAIPVPWAQAD